MSAISVSSPFPIFTDIDGQPLEAGYVWLGTVNLDPQVNPINVYWDAALTIVAVQPIRTLGGYPANSGTPARVYVDSDYSIRVMNKNGSVIYSAPADNKLISALMVSYLPAGAGAVATTVEAKLRESVSANDFGASPSASAAVNGAAIQAALDSIPNYPSAYAPSKLSGGAGEVYVTLAAGSYNVDRTLVMNQRAYQKLIGLGRVTIYSAATTYIIDMASTWRCGIENIDFVSATANVGLYFNRCTSNPFTDYNKISNVNVTLSKGMTANGGQGTIGLYMNRIEQNIFENCAFTCDVPLWNDNLSNAYFPPTNGTQDTTTNSNTINTFIECNFTRNGSAQYGMILNGSISFRFYNCYGNDLKITSGAVPSFMRLNSCSNCLFEFQFDAFIRLADVVGFNQYNEFDILAPSNQMDTGGIFNFDTAGSNYLDNGRIKVFASGTNTGLFLFKQTSGSSTANIRGNIISTPNDLTIASIAFGSVNGAIFTTEAGLTFSNAKYTGTAIFNGVSSNVAAAEGALSIRGGQIGFPPTCVASTDPNTLDDYEIGTWTPSIGGDATYSSQNGSYTKIGNVVSLYCLMIIIVRGTGSTTTVSGFPFPASNAGGGRVGGVTSGFANLAVATTALVPNTTNGASSATFHNMAGQNWPAALAIFGNSARIEFSMVYRTNS